jgi:ubiquinone/menaquinone biosynthesis C-methylase UbiE
MPQTINCQTCKNEIGKLYQIAKGLFLLDTGGGGMASHWRGVCKSCGGIVAFDIDQNALTKTVAEFAKQTIAESEKT